jgi:Family of unknown function (DUF6491)
MNPRSTLGQSLLLAVVVGAAVQAGSAAAVAEKEDAKTAAACLRRTEIKGTKVLDARNVLVTMRDRSTYRSQLAKQCPGLRRGMAMSLTYSDNKLCAGSTFTVLMRAGASTNSTSVTVPGSNEHLSVPGPAFVPGAVCQLGMFTPISEDEIDALVAATTEDQRSRRRSDRDAVKTEAVEKVPATAEPQSR